MDEPTRWRDDGPGDARELFRHAPKTRPMTADERARTSARIAKMGAIGIALSGLAWTHGVAWGAGLGLAVVVAAEVVPNILAPTSEPAPAVLSSVPKAPSSAPQGTVPSTPEVAPPTAIPTASTAVAPSPQARSTPVAEAEAPPPPKDRGGDSLADEAALLDRAQTALAANPEEAIALAETHAVRYPHGKLSMERELLLVDALKRQGRVVEARARIEALLERTDGGLYADRIRSLRRRLE